MQERTRATRAIITGLLLAILGGSSRADDTIEPRLRAEIQEHGFPSLSVGIVRGDERVYSKAIGLADRESQREATPESMYRIGSITKVFTASLLASLRDDGIVRLDDPVAKYLPADAKLPTDPRGAPAITLRHLATHASGLPRLPVNLKERRGDPYGGYSADALVEGLASTRLVFPIGSDCAYSNLGVGLLGHALERAAGKPYEDLLRERIFEPLKMNNTGIRLSDELRKNLATGYTEKDPNEKAVDWNLGVLAPAGGIASSVPDLARFIALQLKAGQADIQPIRGGTLTELHTPQRLIKGWKAAVGLGWHITNSADLGEYVWHNGGMAGYHSYLAFQREKNVGIVVLTNRGISVDELGRWLLSEAIKCYAKQATSAASDDSRIDPALRKLAEKLAEHIVAEPTDAVGDLFDEEFKNQIPVAAIKKVLAGIARRKGVCRGVASIEAGDSPREADVRFKFDDGKSQRAHMVIGDSEPALITGLLFPPD